MGMHDPMHVAVDTGGTFTDVVLRTADGRTRRRKLLSTGAIRARVRAIDGDRMDLGDALRSGDAVHGYTIRRVGVPGSVTTVTDCAGAVLQVERIDGFQIDDIVELTTGETAPSLGVRLITGTALEEPLPPTNLRLGTTRGTNALLERRGATVAFFTTMGFGDLLRIGTQQRPDIFAFPVVLESPLHARTVELEERIAVDGRVLTPLDHQQLRRRAMEAIDAGCTSASVAFLHAWCNDEHEQAAVSILRDCGFEHVTRSSELSPTIRIVPRAQSAVVDATIGPIVGTFLGQVRNELGSASPDLLVMGSGGGLTASREFHAKDALLSGPAGGVAGAVAAGRSWGFDRLLTFDMGGTSTDVSRYDHGFVYTPEQQVGAACLSTMAIDVHTVAAGGGSVCHVEDGMMEVGPHSGGADPGPACYGQGGPLCLTDIDLLAGRLVAQRFGVPVQRSAAEAALDAVRAADDGGRSRDVIVDAMLARADRRMADALREVSLRQGCDPREFVLVAFGGAGAQHACAVADALDMERILLPAGASVLSAEGIAGASVERSEVRQVLRPLDAMAGELSMLVDSMAAAAGEQVVHSGIAAETVGVRRVLLHLRLAGQDSTIAVDWTIGCDPRQRFELRFTALYGYAAGPGRGTGVHSCVGRHESTGASDGRSSRAGGVCRAERAAPDPIRRAVARWGAGGSGRTAVR